ncbi:hypothetical protein F8388_003706 [Cannabis sativa]|uniref:RNase H type-1 domain-containing protein n=1 Tax=Cannabis sativa TaxID=3483 RepID=A0A7J6F786_CANSA|nr:hypothetical protein F8388_003706 [Cannabis sativa]KAF4400912.1 hypothetical protein G4B88_013753 [Cannabis sativa]
MERNAFPTRGKLAGFMELNTICCPVCGEEKETFFHLMWKCTFAKALWFNSSLGLRVEQLCGKKETPLSMVNPRTRYGRKIMEQLHVVSNEVEDFCAWSPPPESWLCCNCDIACDDEGMVVATVVHDDQGRIVTIKTERSHLTDPLIGEAVVVCMAAELMIEKKVAQVVFQSDNIEVVKAFSYATDRDSNFKLVNLRSRFQQLCKGFQNWEIGHVPRRCNFMAHNIAKWARETSVTGITLCNELNHEVLNDYVEWNKHAG